ncbi:hypothetical protein KZZ07_26920, partial [Mameliella sp. CS4]|uniref:hypothetical protein n=1 Tax=Mameliella sp. CS4 TaxID=2862329 RepID=UPI001C5F592F
ANPDAVLAIVTLLQKIAKDGAIKMPLSADDVSTLLQQLIKTLGGQNPAPGPVAPAPAPAPDPAADPTAAIIDLIAKLIVPAISKQIRICL